MNRAQKFFLIFVFLFASTIYVLLFGDVGWIVQSRLERRLHELEENVASLESERKVLQDRYFQIKEAPQAKSLKKIEGREIIILKFRVPHSEFRANRAASRGELSLPEARILYGFVVFFLTLLGYAYLQKRTLL